MTDAEFAELESLCELRQKGTPGPWKPETGVLQCFDEDFDLWYGRGPLKKMVGFEAAEKEAQRDASFIAAAANACDTALPSLLAEVRRLRAELRRQNESLRSAIGRPIEPCP